MRFTLRTPKTEFCFCEELFVFHHLEKALIIQIFCGQARLEASDFFKSVGRDKANISDRKIRYGCYLCCFFSHLSQSKFLSVVLDLYDIIAVCIFYCDIELSVFFVDRIIIIQSSYVSSPLQFSLFCQ